MVVYKKRSSKTRLETSPQTVPGSSVFDTPSHYTVHGIGELFTIIRDVQKDIQVFSKSYHSYLVWILPPNVPHDLILRMAKRFNKPTNEPSRRRFWFKLGIDYKGRPILQAYDLKKPFFHLEPVVKKSWWDRFS